MATDPTKRRPSDERFSDWTITSHIRELHGCAQRAFISLGIGHNTRKVLAGHSGFGIVAFTVRDVRDLGSGLLIRTDPDDPSHVLICGKWSRAQARRLAEQCRWVVMPEGVGR